MVCPTGLARILGSVAAMGDRRSIPDCRWRCGVGDTRTPCPPWGCSSGYSLHAAEGCPGCWSRWLASPSWGSFHLAEDLTHFFPSHVAACELERAWLSPLSSSGSLETGTCQICRWRCRTQHGRRRSDSGVTWTYPGLSWLRSDWQRGVSLAVDEALSTSA